MNKKRVILTGASGFIGANLARCLLKGGHEVHLLLQPHYKPWRIEAIRKDVRIHEVSLRDKETVEATVAGIKPDWVFHLAVYGAYPQQADMDAMVQTNIVGTMNLVGACVTSGFEVFVNTGTSSEYGVKDHPPAEVEALDPNSYYAYTKASATMFCRYTAIRQKANIVTLRPYSVYGPFEEPTRFIPALILSARNGTLPPLVHPSVARDFVYTEDIEEAYLKAATVSPQEAGAIYNVGTGVQTSIREAVEVARTMFKVTQEPRWGSMPSRAWDTSVWIADNRKIRDSLGWKPTVTFQEGLKKTAEWFAQNPELLRYYQAQVKL